MHGKVLEGVFCEKIPETSPFFDRANAICRMGPQLTKAKPVSNGGSASGITVLRTEKNYCAAAIAAREKIEILMQIQIAPKSRKFLTADPEVAHERTVHGEFFLQTVI